MKFHRERSSNFLCLAFPLRSSSGLRSTKWLSGKSPSTLRRSPRVKSSARGPSVSLQVHQYVCLCDQEVEGSVPSPTADTGFAILFTSRLRSRKYRVQRLLHLRDRTLDRHAALQEQVQAMLNHLLLYSLRICCLESEHANMKL